MRVTYAGHTNHCRGAKRYAMIECAGRSSRAIQSQIHTNFDRRDAHHRAVNYRAVGHLVDLEKRHVTAKDLSRTGREGPGP